MSIEALLSVCLGLGLAAACGFRVFVPLLAVSLAARVGWLSLASELAWMAETPALTAFAVATVLEIVAYYVPWLDNFLDSVATPAAVVAGVVVTASVVTGMDPALKWILAVIAGGGVAGSVQSATVGGRVVSAMSTAGLANPLVATTELAGSVFLSTLSILAPLAAGLLLVVGCILVLRHRRRTQEPIWRK